MDALMQKIHDKAINSLSAAWLKIMTSDNLMSSVRMSSGDETASSMFPQVSPPTPKMPWIKLPVVSITTISLPSDVTTVPSIYALTSTGIGVPRSVTCPVIVDIDSIVPSIGDSILVLNRPKKLEL